MACRSSKLDSTFFEHNPMNTPTPTPRTDAAWAQTFDANGFLSGRGNAATDMRDECATLERELAALTAERDQLRAEVETERNLHAQTRTVVEELNTICTDLKNAGGPPFIRSEAIRLLREDQAALRAELAAAQLIADSEARATAELRGALALGQENCDDAYDELATDCAELRADVVRLTARAERAEAELTAEREKAERYRLTTLKLDAELAAERARLDWVFRNCKVTADDYTTGNRDVYAIHDREDLGAAMKEDAK